MITTEESKAKTMEFNKDDLELTKNEAMCNFTRYSPDQKQGHYESFFQRANHPEKKQAFWIRYTIFSPHKHSEKAIGELWAVYFDGENNEHVAVKREVSFSRCHFDYHAFTVKIDDSELNAYSLDGNAGSDFSWNLNYQSKERPLFLLPGSLYEGGFPKAKALVGSPLAVYNGTLKVKGNKIKIDNWVGSQNHNWGSQHTDRYAWGQVAGFDNAEQSFLEVATAQIKVGPIYTPKVTLFVLRHLGKEYRFNELTNFFSNKADYDYFEWHFAGENDGVGLNGIIKAKASDFVGLNYYNPPGGSKTCLNSKVASCHITLAQPSGKTETLATENRAAFEILTDDKDHGIEVRC